VAEVIRAALARGESEFVAAGGDGTVNLLASTLAAVAPRDLERLALGAVGLGSSNDFHKPRAPRGLVAGIPTRLDFAHASLRDVCGLVTTDDRGRVCLRYFLVNASIGITAEANWRFNHPGRWLAFLKRTSTGAAITWAALSTLLRAEPLLARVGLDGAAPERVALHNLGVVKCPHFAGGLHYDSPFEPTSGRLCVHQLRAMPLLPLLRIFSGLSRGRFAGRRGTASGQARRVTVSADRPFAVEGDGEVVRAVRAEFFVLPQRLKVCPS